MQRMTENEWNLFIWLAGACFFAVLGQAADRLSLQILHGQKEDLQAKDGQRHGRDQMPRKAKAVRLLAMGMLGGFLAVLEGERDQGVSAWLTVFFFGILAATARVDAETMEIPDRFPAGIFLLALIRICCGEGESLPSGLLGFFIVSFPMFLVSLAVPGAFGGGDMKLMASCGLFLGWKTTALSMFFAIMGGGIWGSFLLIRKKARRTDHFAFGPFLCAGMGVAFFWGERILSWYMSRMR